MHLDFWWPDLPCLFLRKQSHIDLKTSPLAFFTSFIWFFSYSSYHFFFWCLYTINLGSYILVFGYFIVFILHDQPTLRHSIVAFTLRVSGHPKSYFLVAASFWVTVCCRLWLNFLAHISRYIFSMELKYWSALVRSW